MDSERSFYLQAFILSILLHFVLFLSAKEWASERNIKKEIIEVTYQDEEKNKKRSQIIIEDPKVGFTTEENRKKIFSRFLSKFFKRVKEETVAKREGEITNNTTPPPSSRPLSKGNGEISSPFFHQSPPSMTTLSIPFGRLKTAHFTALNTDQFRFYAFFDRTKKQIRPRWKINLENYFNKLMTKDELEALTRKSPRITRLEIILNSEGHYKETIVHKSSGFKEVDYAAIDSIVEASPLLNPPPGLIRKEDGNIHLHYIFSLTWI